MPRIDSSCRIFGLAIAIGMGPSIPAWAQATTELVSQGSDGVVANADSRNPSISADGRFVAFTTRSWNLGPARKPNGYVDVFVRDRKMRTTRQVNVGLNGFQANASRVLR